MTRLVPLFPPGELWSNQSTAQIVPVDIGTDFGPDDYISVALPNFPADSLDLTQSFIDFTSDPEGSFGTSDVDRVAFSEGLLAFIDGNDSEFRFKLSRLYNCDLTSITGVRLELAAIADCTVQCLSIRCLSKDWSLAPVDLDTITGHLVPTKSTNGSVDETIDTTTGAWPGPSTYPPLGLGVGQEGLAPFTYFPDTPTPWPILWRSDNSPSFIHPSPVDITFAVRFNPGSISNTDPSQLSLYFREKSLDYVTQLDLDGTLGSDLNGEPQPDFTLASYAPRLQEDLDKPPQGVVQSDLDGLAQITLERKPDNVSAAYMEARLNWDSDGATVEIWDTVGGPYYTFPVTLEANQDYLWTLSLKESAGRFQIHTIQGNQRLNEVLDTTVIEDPSVFKRRKGRVGWFANFVDGDAFVDYIRPSYTNHGEYRTLPYASFSPVSGTQLQVGATGDADLFIGINPGPWGGQFYSYPERGPFAFRVRNTSNEPLQGFQSNPMVLDDFKNTTVSFQLSLTQAALDLGALNAFLWDGIRPISLPLTGLKGNAWNTLEINLADVITSVDEDEDDHGPVPGTYTLVIVQSIVGLPNDWAVDNIHVIRRNIEWAARSYQDDAWDLHEEDWIPLGGALADPQGGVVFTERSRKFQIRAKALRANAKIGQIRVQPKYATLGRFVWADEAPAPSFIASPTCDFDYAIHNERVTFTSTSTDSDGRIVSYNWTFGDGSKGSGIITVHAFAPGTYPVTLTVTDNKGNRSSTTQSVTVS